MANYEIRGLVDFVQKFIVEPGNGINFKVENISGFPTLRAQSGPHIIQAWL